MSSHLHQPPVPFDASPPRVSIVMPIYNGQRYLAQAIDSMLTQTFAVFELVVVNDGSTDRTEDIVSAIAASDKRVRLISQQNTGIVGALNRGLDEARGELIARMDADDVALPQRLESQIAYLDAHPDCVAVGSRCTLIDAYDVAYGSDEQPLDHESIDARHMGGKGGGIMHPTALIRADAIKQIGGYRQQTCWAEDLDLFLRLAEIGQLANLPDHLLRYRVHAQSVSRSKRQKQLDAIATAVLDARSRRGVVSDEDPAAGAIHENAPAGDQLFRMMVIWTLRAGARRAAIKHAMHFIRRKPQSLDAWRTLKWALLDKAGDANQATSHDSSAATSKNVRGAGP